MQKCIKIAVCVIMLGCGVGVAAEVDRAEAVRNTKHSCFRTFWRSPGYQDPKVLEVVPNCKSLVFDLLGCPNFLGTCPMFLIKPQVTSETECSRPETFSLVLVFHWCSPLRIPSICSRLAPLVAPPLDRPPPHHQHQTAGEAARLTTNQLQLSAS